MKLTKAQLKQLRGRIQATHTPPMSTMARLEKSYPNITSGVKDAIAGVKQYGHDVITGKIASEGFNRMMKINTTTPKGIEQLVGMMPIGGLEGAVVGGIKDIGESLISRILKKTGTNDIEDAIDVLKKGASPAKKALENLTHPSTDGMKVTEITSIPKDAEAKYAEWLKTKPNISSGEDITKPSFKYVAKSPVEDVVKKQSEAIIPKYGMTRSEVDRAVKMMVQGQHATPREALDFLEKTHIGANVGSDIAKTHIGANVGSDIAKAHIGANVGSDIAKTPEAIKTPATSPSDQEVGKLGALLKIHRRLFASMPDGPKKDFVGRKIKEMTQRILVIGGKK